MNDKIDIPAVEIPPPPPVPSGRASTVKTEIKFGAFTDWLIVVCATVLTALDKFPAEWTFGLFIGIAGLVVAMKGMGKTGGSVTGLVLLAVKKLSIAIGLSAILFGCAAGSGTTALKILAPLAVDAIRAAAESKKVTLDEAAAFCEELVIGDVDFPGVVVICWTPEIE